jgi:hypothetical protein
MPSYRTITSNEEPYIPDPEQLNQQRFKCAAQMREPLYLVISW